LAIGTLIWWNPDRGFGFIKPDSGGPDIFLHESDLEEAGIHLMVLKVGQRLSYDTTEYDGKPKAVDIQLA
jgi:CspA family cold shock protein